ncbi:MAG: hypothetical protein IKW15_03540 [Bacteroidales bacterium]|nr:hypothetical protein [Bacteroidales bacterium]
MENDVLNIGELEIPQLQALVSRYPWFSYAREVLLYRLVSVEPECLENSYKENLIYFPKRDQVLLKSRSIVAAAKMQGGQMPDASDVAPLLDVAPLPEKISQGLVEVLDGEEEFEIDFQLMQQEAENFKVEAAQDVVVEERVEKTQEEKPKIFVVGGDYFSKEDFDQLEQGERVAEIKLGAPADNVERGVADTAAEAELDFESMDFVTETLAAIYADQGYYEKAIDAYAKLILLYPEKSSYFASLVNEIKLKN